MKMLSSLLLIGLAILKTCSNGNFLPFHHHMAIGGKDFGKLFISRIMKMLKECYNAYFKAKGLIIKLRSTIVKLLNIVESKTVQEKKIKFGFPKQAITTVTS